MKNIQEAEEKYEERFNRHFPVYIGLDLSDETKIELIEKCLKRNSPIKDEDVEKYYPVYPYSENIIY